MDYPQYKHPTRLEELDACYEQLQNQRTIIDASTIPLDKKERHYSKLTKWMNAVYLERYRLAYKNNVA